MEVSGLNSTQTVPIEGGGGLGLDAVGRLVYLSIMATVGRAENVIFLRLEQNVRIGGKSLAEGLWNKEETGGELTPVRH